MSSTPNAEDLIRSLGGRHVEVLEGVNTRRIPVEEPQVQTRNGELANVTFEWETKPNTATPDYSAVRIPQSLFLSKGTTFRLWNNLGYFAFDLRIPGGSQYWGKLVGPDYAQGSFPQCQTHEDHAFRELVFQAFVQPNRTSMMNSPNPNHTASCSALWSNNRRSGNPVPHTFVNVQWKLFQSGKGYPFEVTILDGTNIKTIRLERYSPTHVSDPIYTGVI